MNGKITIEVNERQRILLDVQNGGGCCQSNLKTGEEGDEEFDAAVDGMEALILAMAVHGVDVTSEPVVKAIRDALQAIDNNT